MPDKVLTRERYGEAFWRKHHEAWQQSALNQREYCEAQGIPLKAFGNWRAKVKAETLLRPKPGLRLEWRSQHGQNKPNQRDKRAHLAHSVTSENPIRISVPPPGTPPLS